jgi:hypothetical protein
MVAIIPGLSRPKTEMMAFFIQPTPALRSFFPYIFDRRYVIFSDKRKNQIFLDKIPSNPSFQHSSIPLFSRWKRDERSERSSNGIDF